MNKINLNSQVHAPVVFCFITHIDSPELNCISLTSSKTEAATGGFCKKKVFLKISQISQESTCVGDYF